MSGRCLLDTNIVIALFGGDSRVREHFAAAEELFTASIVIGELYFGARKSRRRAENVAQVADFVASSKVLSCDVQTARWYGEVKAGLRERGQPIPDNDIWIAAVVRQHDLTLITRDNHFGQVQDLKTQAW